MKLTNIAPAKINLYLHITGKRDDGYHLLESLVIFAEDISDVIEISPAQGLFLDVDGAFAKDLCSAENNLVYKAAKLLAEKSGIKPEARIKLTKNLPVESGIGGGSSDAATAVKLLCKLWELPYSLEDLAKITLPLGADMPVCIMGESALISGIGESIKPVKLPKMSIVLVNPQKPVSSAEVYRMGGLKYRSEIREIPKTLIEFLHGTENELTKNAIKLVPEIEEILSRLRSCKRCLFAGMSGSGATCFGIFEDDLHAGNVKFEMKKTWWVS